MKKLTIITPTYNRAHILSKVYESLKKQTCNDFIWMLVDDGSNDNTEEVVNSFISEGIVDIIYIKKDNGGKGSALNVGLDKLTTEIVTCLDSDDCLSADAVEKVLKKYNTIINDSKCCGILAFRSNPDGTPMGGIRIPETMKNVTATDIFMNLNSRGELICFYKKEIISKYRFPKYKGENFFSPSWMHYELSRNYYFRSTNDVLCICEYLEDGLTKNVRKLHVNNPNSYRCIKKLHFEHANTIRLKVKHGIMYDCACILSKYSDWFTDSPRKLLSVLLMPFAYGVYLAWYKKLIDNKG